MSLLQNEEFAIYQLRTSYLSHIHDGIGERLINVDASFLNSPAFRAAGWSSNAPEIKRTYSPPIPTSENADYFQAPPRSAALPGTALGDEEDDATLGRPPRDFRKNSEDTVAAAPINKLTRRRREQLDEDDDSSDLSDESNDENESRPANQIKFAKMPVRSRADSSPARGIRKELSPIPDEHQPDGPSFFITSPSRPPDSGRLRSGSLSAIGAEPVKTRSRGDTTTSSDMSSEGDLDPSTHRRRRPRLRPGQTLESHLEEDDGNSTRPSTAASGVESLGQSGATSQDEREIVDSEEDVESDVDSLASGFSETVGSGSLLERVGHIDSASLVPPIKTPNLQTGSPRKTVKKTSSDALQELPPARPISTVQPVSALAAQIKAKNKNPNSVFDRFSALSGDKSLDALYIKIYTPFSSDPEEPMQIQLRKTSNEGSAVSVAEAIGYSLLQYMEEKHEPAIEGGKLNVNKWVLRIIEDGEVDFDFPPLTRTAPIADFTSNNNRPARGRQRDKPWDEFGLVEATDDQFRENERLTPGFSEEAAAASSSAPASTSTATATADHPPMPGQAVTAFAPAPVSTDPLTPVTEAPEPTFPLKPTPSPRHQQPAPGARPPQNPITNPRFAFTAARKDSFNALDAPAETAPTAQARKGAPRTLTIHYTDASLRTQLLSLEVTTDTYLSEVFAAACTRLGIDRALHVLRVTGTTTVAPTDRTVEALGGRADLDLARRRFANEPAFPLSGSHGSSSPNAPLLLTAVGSPKPSRRAARRPDPLNHHHHHQHAPAHPLALAQHADGPHIPPHPLSLGLGLSSTPYKRYAVLRRQPMSFTPNQPRTLILDSEYLHILPAEHAAAAGAGGKTHIVPFGSVIGVKVSRKHPKTFRVVVFRERESKKYDFEADSVALAAEIVAEIERGVAPFREAGAR